MGAIYEVVSRYLPFLRKRPALTREQALRTRPIRNQLLKWKKGEEQEIRLLLPRRNDRIARALCWLFRAPEYKEIVLDEVGSDIWELCDGGRGVEAIVSAIAGKYKMTRRECETSVSMYLKMLAERNLIGFQMGGRQKK
jgi:hypothetical protein